MRRSRGLGDVYKRQELLITEMPGILMILNFRLQFRILFMSQLL
jgi:hypothetical protein